MAAGGVVAADDVVVGDRQRRAIVKDAAAAVIAATEGGVAADGAADDRQRRGDIVVDAAPIVVHAVGDGQARNGDGYVGADVEHAAGSAAVHSQHITAWPGNRDHVVVHSQLAGGQRYGASDRRVEVDHVAGARVDERLAQ